MLFVTCVCRDRHLHLIFAFHVFFPSVYSTGEHEMNFLSREENALSVVYHLKRLIYSVLQSCSRRFYIVLAVHATNCYCTVIRINIHGLVHVQLLVFCFIFSVFGYKFLRLHQMEGNNASYRVCIHPTWPNFMPKAYITYIRP